MPILPANTPRFTFTVGGRDFSVRRFKGHESISKLFEFELELVSKESNIAFDSVINQMGSLKLQQFDDVSPRYVHGMVNYFEQRNQEGKYTNYYAQLVPLIWILTQRHTCRIFQKKDIKTIIAEVLNKAGIPADFYRFELQGTHPQREYSVQYRETDWNFISRLMEEEGVFCFFEHNDDEPVFVMQDQSYAHPPIPSPETVIFHEISNYAPDEEYLFFFNYAESIRSGKATLRDFNFKKPTMDMERDKEADKTPELEVYDYPGLYDDPGVGKSLASVRLEAFQTPRKQGSGESTSMRFIPGYRFTLDQHPRDDFNKSYLITSLIQEGKQPQVLQEQAGNDGTEYTSELKCIPAEVSYRPQRVTRKPVVDGPQTAIVVGPGGEEIYVDQHGRVKVQFHWDREGQMNEKSSCWIRVSQVWAGQKWGAMYIPRIGHEVIVDFLEGDPDRPIITGRVYHGDNLPPYSPPQNKTKSTIKSNSSPGGGGFNEIRFEDKKSQEEVYLQAEKDWNTLVKNNRSTTIGNDDTLTIGHDRTKKVGNNETNTIQKNRTTTVVKGNDSLTVGLNRTETIGANQTNTITGVETVTIKGEPPDDKCDDGPADDIGKGSAQGAAMGASVGGVAGAMAGAAIGAGIAAAKAAKEGSSSRKVTIIKGDDELTVQDGSHKTVIVQGDSFASSPKGLNQITSKDIKIVATNSILIQCGAGSISIDKVGNIQISAPKISIGGKALIDIKAPLVKINS